MRNIFTYLFMLLGFVALSQNKQILYGFSDIPQSLLANPGEEVRYKKHFGIPFLSHIYINGGSSGVTAYDIFMEGNGNINDRITAQIFKMKNSDFFTATQQMELLSFGWRSKKNNYYSGGIYQEFDFIAYFPKDLAILGWEGNREYLDYEFNFDELSTTGDFLTVYHFGLNKKINKKLTVGARVKLYSSIASFRSVNNKGTFVTSLADADSENIYEHTIKDADVTVETSGFSMFDETGQAAKKIFKKSLFGGDIGVGVDLGFSYEINDAWTLSASALDVGAIVHSRDVETYHGHGNYTLNGINLLFPPLADGESTYPYYDDLVDEIEREVPIDTLHASYIQFRPVKINAGISYGFGRFNTSDACDCLNMNSSRLHAQAIGFQFYGILRPKGPQMAGTLYYFRRISQKISAKATYTVDPFSYYNIGVGATANFWKINFYLGADNLLSYGNLAKANNVSLQLGFNIIIDD